MATTADIKKGVCLEFNNGLYMVIDFQHVKPGKGPAFVRTKLKNVSTGKVVDNTFSSGHKITTARIERRPHQFVYKDDFGYNFMNMETFDQIAVEEDLVENADLMKDGQDVEILVHAEQEKVLGVDLPQYVILSVTYSEPGVKGDTATNATKPATMETGAIIQVPLFINEGDVIKVNTEDRSYSERVKQ
ncbi:elongation factor P [Sediminitomix flava]|uniref:Elongation factor P n=1 Tax=Sediminitomix flava TaxID=379075 RepID=A0A315Z754_SEDFL|nr:elongation factor P [Sediminitomix flava]PWJ38605.1 translation elongation factor P (EF-P) [Sediminitomix flava]